MRIFYKFFFFLVCLQLTSSCALDRPEPSLDKIPLLDGGYVDLTDDKTIIFINYWAVWCKPCIKEMPELKNFLDQHSDRASVYVYNFDNPKKEVLLNQLDRLDVQLHSITVDPSQFLDLPGPSGLPTTLVLRDGLVFDILVGPQTMESLTHTLTSDQV